MDYYNADNSSPLSWIGWFWSTSKQVDSSGNDFDCEDWANITCVDNNNSGAPFEYFPETMCSNVDQVTCTYDNSISSGEIVCCDKSSLDMCSDTNFV